MNEYLVLRKRGQSNSEREWFSFGVVEAVDAEKAIEAVKPKQHSGRFIVIQTDHVEQVSVRRLATTVMEAHTMAESRTKEQQ